MRTVAEVVGALVIAPLLGLTVWIWRGYSRPSAVLVFEGLQMWVLAPAWVVLIVATVGGVWWLVVPAGIVAAAHLAFSLPAAMRDPVPAWVADAPTFSVFVANVRYDNDRHDEVARVVTDAATDVVVLNETTVPQRDALRAAGTGDRYATRVHVPGRPFGETLMTRLPVTQEGVDVLGGQRFPVMTMLVAGRPVRVYSVHVNAPKSSKQRHSWRRHLDGLGSAAERGDEVPVLLAGDFNSAPWHGPFRKLLRRGLTDAHDAMGRGLTRSWTSKHRPLSWFGPLMRLDHALFTDGLFPVALREVDVPGSDHRGFVVDLAVRPDPSG